MMSYNAQHLVFENLSRGFPMAASTIYGRCRPTTVSQPTTNPPTPDPPTVDPPTANRPIPDSPTADPPSPNIKPIIAGSWRAILGFANKSRPSIDEVETRFKDLARIHHPDVGGTNWSMALLNTARKAARAALSPRRSAA